jgi:hypothetical protein
MSDGVASGDASAMPAAGREFGKDMNFFGS